MADCLGKAASVRCSTTHRDLSLFRRVCGVPVVRRTRPTSPTRRHRPHPRGVFTQTALNGSDREFLIWKPEHGSKSSSAQDNLPRLKINNFCVGMTAESKDKQNCFTRLMNKPVQRLPSAISLCYHSDYTVGTEASSDLKWSILSTTQDSYRWPRYPTGVQHRVNTTRYGCQKRTPATGIVPTALPDIHPKVYICELEDIDINNISIIL